jgi:beta-glucosidase
MKRKHLTAHLVMLLVVAALTGCVSRQRQIFQTVAQKSHSAVTPVARNNQKWWADRHQGVLERVAQGNVDLIFIGDSITHSWENAGKELWQEYYASRNAVNMGFSGDRTQHVLWRLENGEVDDINPQAAVIMIGTNNSNRKDNTAEEIADGIIAICAKLREKLPQTKILILAIFPRGEEPSAQREKNAHASALASQIADGRMIHYLDFGDKFLQPDKTLTKDIMPDFLHLTPKGYRIWAEGIESQLAVLMEEGR